MRVVIVDDVHTAVPAEVVFLLAVRLMTMTKCVGQCLIRVRVLVPLGPVKRDANTIRLPVARPRARRIGPAATTTRTGPRRQSSTLGPQQLPQCEAECARQAKQPPGNTVEWGGAQPGMGLSMPEDSPSLFGDPPGARIQVLGAGTVSIANREASSVGSAARSMRLQAM